MTTENTAKKKDDGQWQILPDAELDPVLDAIDAELRGCHKTTEPIEAFGGWYVLRTLDPEEEGWADEFTSGEQWWQVAKSTRAPRLAAALVSIGKSKEGLKPIEACFKIPKVMTDEQRALFENNPVVEQNWRRRMALKWLVKKGTKHTRLLEVL